MSWVYRRPFDYRPSQKLGHGFRVLAYAAGAMVGTASLNFGDASTLTGAGALASSEAITLGASAIAGTGDPNAISGSAVLLFTKTAVLRGTGALASAEPLVIGGSGTLAGTNAYQPLMYPKKRRDPEPIWNYAQWDARRWTIFPYSINTATSGIGSLAIGGDGLLRGTGRLIGSSAHTLGATGTVVATGILAGTTSLTVGQTADLTSGASGAITALQGFEFGGSGTLTGTGALYGPADLEFDGSATYTILFPPSGTVPLVLNASGRLTNAAEGANVITAMSFSSNDGLQMYFSA